ncbi:branched-chain amino acid ABC transporter permease, partial [Streptomyces sp. NPDC050619]
MTETTMTLRAVTVPPAPKGLIPLPAAAARALILIGGIATAASAYLAWTWTSEFPGDLTVTGYPGGLQWLTFTAGVLTALFALGSYRVRGLGWLIPGGNNAPLVLTALSGFAVTWYTVISIAVELGGLANLEPGGWIAAIAALIPVLGAFALPEQNTGTTKETLKAYITKPDNIPAGRSRRRRHRAGRAGPTAIQRTSGWGQRAVITLVTIVGLAVFTYGIDTEYGELFIGYLIVVIGAVWALHTAGLLQRFSGIVAHNRSFMLAVGFLAAIAFPFTQTDDHYANIGVNILIFGTVA